MPGLKRELSTEPVPYDYEANNPVYLRVHMNDGSIYNLDRWLKNDSLKIIQGKGTCFDQNRNKIVTSPDSIVNISLADVALFETNEIKGIGGAIGLAAMTMVPTAIVTIICIVDPKACFGSCPTFYAWDGNKMRLMAEGFSSSIARAFEESDIDMLHSAVIKDREFTLWLTNEALETHAVKFADLLAIPRKENERVFATPEGEFFITDKICKPSASIAPEGDCLQKVLEMDRSERYSTADQSDLLKKETIEITFSDAPKGETGLIIGSRQTFMTTYLFYQGMAHAGSRMPYYLAEVERGNKKMQRHLTKIWDMLGTIEIFLQNKNGNWEKTGEIDEMGPIAADLQLMKLPANERNEVNIRLRMTKGLWRIDQVGLVQTDRKIEPVRISPVKVLKDSLKNEAALAALRDTGNYLITLPGDHYELTYELPDNSVDYELFLFSRGYYLEWMREGWLEEEDLLKMAVMFTFPKYYLRMVAPDFKKIEPGMEEMFWNSRYVAN